MKSLRVRLTLWFTLGFLAVAVIFMLFTFRRLDLELRRGTFERATTQTSAAIATSAAMHPSSPIARTSTAIASQPPL